MHSTIFQFNTSPIPEDEFLKEDKVTGNMYSKIDYVSYIKDEDADERLDRLVHFILPKGMFQRRGNILVYKGGYTEWSKGYCERLTKLASDITPAKCMKWIGPTCQLQKACQNPLNTSCLFCDDFTNGGGIANSSEVLMRIVSNMQIGEKLYIGRILDYHF